MLSVEASRQQGVACQLVDPTRTLTHPVPADPIATNRIVSVTSSLERLGLRPSGSGAKRSWLGTVP